MIGFQTKKGWVIIDPKKNALHDSFNPNKTACTQAFGKDWHKMYLRGYRCVRAESTLEIPDLCQEK